MSSVPDRVRPRRGLAAWRLGLWLAVVLIATLALPGHAWGVDLKGRQGQLGTQQAQIQQQLKSAQASDSQVQAGVAALDQIAAADQRTAATAQAQLADAQSAVQFSDQLVVEATAQLEKTRNQVAAAQHQLRVQAVSAYVNGGTVSALSTLFASNPTQAELIAQYRATAAGSTRDAVDVLHSAQAQLALRQAALRTAQHQAQLALTGASERFRAAAAAAASALSAANTQRYAHVVLQRRIADFTSESSTLAAQQQQIASLIAQRAARSGSALSPGPGGNNNLGLIWPVHGPVTSEFGPRWGGFHPGIDIADPTGTPIHAARSGQVIYAGWESGYGNFVLIDHGAGVVTGYAHQTQIAVVQGQNVSQNEVIGYVGSTGDSTGPHLHFEVRINGSPRNPRDYVAGSP
ncbi:MAG: murein hydrolase activator EnvC family protein [Acidimicrobiales bacterium]